MKIIFSAVIFLFLYTEVSSKNVFQYKSEDISNGALDIFFPQYMYNEVLNITDILNFVSDYAQVVFAEENECTRQLQLLYDHVALGDMWALQMLDASAKPQSGILHGNIMQIGNYDECLKVNVNVNETQIMGKYCTVPIDLKKEQELEEVTTENLEQLRTSYGFCIPAACDAKVMQQMVSTAEEYVKSPLHFHFYEKFCVSEDSKFKPFSNLDIFAIVFFAMIGVLVILSTTYDILVYQNKDGPKEIDAYTAFSFYSNGKKLFSTKTSPDSIHCLNGLKVISIIWIIMCHRYMYQMYRPLTNTLDLLEWKDKLHNSFILAGSLAVDTFFVSSGLLIVYVYNMHVQKGLRVSWIMFYVHRILRLTPSLAAMALFYSTLLSRLAHGPFWFVVSYIFQEACVSNWWATLLYIQNYATPSSMCVGQSWYLAVDTQLYFLSPIILISLMKWPKRTIATILVIATTCTVSTFVVSYQKKIGPSFFGVAGKLFQLVYGTTHARLNTWVIGFILGYVIFKTKDKKIKINKLVVGAMWILSLGAMFSIICVHRELAGNYQDDLVLESALFNSLVRPLWGFSVSVIIFACVKGYGGIINDFLAWPIFSILIRLTYSMYMTHIIVIIYFLAQFRTPEYVTNLTQIHLFWGDFAFTTFVSIIWTLAFESPIIILEKVIFGKKKATNDQIQDKNHGGKIKSCSDNGSNRLSFGKKADKCKFHEEPVLTKISIISNKEDNAD